MTPVCLLGNTAISCKVIEALQEQPQYTSVVSLILLASKRLETASCAGKEPLLRSFDTVLGGLQYEIVQFCIGCPWTKHHDRAPALNQAKPHFITAPCSSSLLSLLVCTSKQKLVRVDSKSVSLLNLHNGVQTLHTLNPVVLI